MISTFIPVWNWLTRSYNEAYANAKGYYWLPCVVCGAHHGGHQRGGTRMTTWGMGTSTCVACYGVCEKRTKLLKEFCEKELGDYYGNGFGTVSTRNEHGQTLNDKWFKKAQELSLRDFRPIEDSERYG